MNTTNVTVGGTKDTSKLQKPRFRPGMLLEHEDLELLTTYTRDLSRLLFGSFFGCGVICGLVVQAEEKCDKLQITVGSGVALACSGDPIEVPKDQVFSLHDDYSPPVAAKLWVVLCGTSKCCAPRTAICSSEDEETTSECTREKYSFEIRVVTERPACVCGCPEPEAGSPNNTTLSNAPANVQGQTMNILGTSAHATDCKCVDPTLPCYKDHYDGKCGCHCDECSDCDCKCILLARLDRAGDKSKWTVDHRVRRFVRPVLMRDPQVELEQKPHGVSAIQHEHTVTRSLNEAAFLAAEHVVLQTAEKAAQAASQAAQEAANKLGKRAADEVVRQVVEEAARQAAEEALKKRAAEQDAKVAAELATAQQSPKEANELGTEQQDASQQEGTAKTTTKQKKSSKSSKSGLPPRS